MRARSAITLVVAFVVLATLPSAALGQQQNPPPNTFEDGFDGVCDGANCTLREAVELAFTGETIVLEPGAYVLDPQLGPLFPEVDLTIAGAGARATTVSGANGTQVLEIGLEETDVTLRGVTVTGGNGASQGSFGRGGAIFVFQDASLTVEDSTIAGNSTPGSGGAIYSNGTVTLNRTTVSGNAADVVGGGVYGGDIELGGLLSMTSSTVSGNTAPSGGGVAAGALVVTRSTIAANTAERGAGLLVLSSESPPTINDTIVAAGTPNACLGLQLVNGSHNLSSDTTCPFVSPGDMQGVNPLLGPLQDNGGPTNTQPLFAGSPAVGGANPVTCVGADQRGVPRPQEGTCDIGAFEYVPPPPASPPPPTPPPGEELPPPEVRKSVNVLPKKGRVRIKLRGKGQKFTRLREGQQIPLGSIIDTRKGRVTLVAAANTKGKTATADFYKGLFKVGQTKGARPITTLKLTEKLRCGKGGKASAAKKKKRKRGKRKRRLWGNGKGRFRTRGKYSAATVRGTKWLTVDRCKRTVTRVRKGKVAVRDLVKKKTVIVKRGEKYVAKKRRR